MGYKGLMEVETGNKDIGYYTKQVHSLRIRSDTNEKMHPTPFHLKMATDSVSETHSYFNTRRNTRSINRII